MLHIIYWQVNDNFKKNELLLHIYNSGQILKHWQYQCYEAMKPQTRILLHCWWEFKVLQVIMEIVWQFFTKLNRLLPYDPAITSPVIYQKKLQIYVHTKTCIWIAKNQKYRRYLSVDEWLNKLATRAMEH